MTPKLLDHFRAMQSRAADYILPPDQPYVSIDGNSSNPSGNTELVGIEAPQRNWLFANDMLYMLDGPEQRAAQAEAEFDYIKETELTASNVFGAHNSDVVDLLRDVQAFVRAAQALDKHKKVLFRKRTSEEAGLPAPGPDRTSAYVSAVDADLFHGAIGLATESGEIMEIVEKYLCSGGYFKGGFRADRVNVREEIGDVLWYVARLIKWAGTTFLAEMMRNITKLRNRHGTEGFNKERDGNRDLAAERKLLEITDSPVVGLQQIGKIKKHDQDCKECPNSVTGGQDFG